MTGRDNVRVRTKAVNMSSHATWFLVMMREHEEFEVKTDVAEEPPLPFWSETVRRVVVE